MAQLDLRFEGPFSSCYAAGGHLRVWPGAARFGEFNVTVMLQDDGPIEVPTLSFGTLGAPLPKNDFETFLTVRIVHENKKPEFSVASELVQVPENSGCVSGEPFWDGLSDATCNRNESYRHVRAGFVTGISMGDIFENGLEKCTAEELDSAVPRCVHQVGTFSVTLVGETALFTRAPQISSDGTLSFILGKNRFGEARFEVRLEDDSGAISDPRTFTIRVKNVNQAPFFSIPQRIVGYESTEFDMIVCPQLSPGEFEEDVQSLTFTVVTADASLFAEPPAIDSDCRLTFRPLEYVYGATTLSVTLRDDGGSDDWGVDTSATATLALELLPVNQGPSFELPESIFVLENMGLYRRENLVKTMSPGPDNENGVCNTYPGDCDKQLFIFEFLVASNPDIFSVLPRLDENGTLTFQTCNGCTGATEFCMTGVDTGGTLSDIDLTGCVTCGSASMSTNSVCCKGTFTPRSDDDNVAQSPARCAMLFVEPVDSAPGFQLPWDVNCNTTDWAPANCSCKALSQLWDKPNEAQLPCGTRLSAGSPRASLVVLEDSGSQRVAHFASSISGADGFTPGSEALFKIEDADAGDLSFLGRRIDVLATTPGLEYVGDRAESADGYHFFTESEPNSVSVWKEGVDGSLEFVDRRTEGESRLRFTGFGTEGESQYLAPSVTLAMKDACSMRTFEDNGKTYVSGATGCNLLEENLEFVRNETYEDEAGWSNIIGQWDFGTSSLYVNGRRGPMKLGPWEVAQPAGVNREIVCGDTFCEYRRDRFDRIGCNEKYATTIAPAAFRDDTDLLGAAVLIGRGSQCKANTDWDTPQEHTLSATNFIGSADGIEAMQFDDQLSTGLLVTDNIDELVNGDPASSRLPLEELTLEAWFSIGEGDSSDHPLVSTMQRRRCSIPSKPSNCGCGKGWMLSWRYGSPDEFGNFPLILSLVISVDGNAKDPEQYGTFFPPGIGSGIGVLHYNEWQSPYDYVVDGSWVHVVATYDGHHTRIYSNGTLQQERPACTNWEDGCGNIIYSAAYHTCPFFCECPPGCEGKNCPCGSNKAAGGSFAACLQGSDAPVGKKTPLTIGQLFDVDRPAASPVHVGMIKRIRIGRRAATLAYVESQYRNFLELFVKSAPESLYVNKSAHWFSSNGQGSPQPPMCQPTAPEYSPSVTYINVAEALDEDTFTVSGMFDIQAVYKARFSHKFLLPLPEENSQDTASGLSSPHRSFRRGFVDTACTANPYPTKISTARISEQWTDKLTCRVPKHWNFGFKAAVLDILQQQRGSTAEWEYIWNRLCARSSCGFAGLLSDRSRFDQSWAIKSGCCGKDAACADGLYQISTAVSGTVAYVRLLGQSTMFLLDSVAETFQAESVISTRNIAATSSADQRLGIFDNVNIPFSLYKVAGVLGAASIRGAVIDGIRFVFVANFWDGVGVQSESNILRIDDIENGVYTKIQGIPTSGARDIRHINVRGSDLLVVLNYGAPSSVYRWTGSTGISSVVIEDPGSNYIAGKIVLRCASVVCSGNNQFLHTFAVNSNGALVSTSEKNPGANYLPDNEVAITYNDGKSIMDLSIPTATLKSGATFVCSRQIAGVTLRWSDLAKRDSVTGDVVGCNTGDEIFVSHLTGRAGWRVTITARWEALDAQNNTVMRFNYSFVPGLADTDYTKWMIQSSRAECVCAAGAWSNCIEDVDADLSYPRARVVTSSGSAGSGFEVALDWNAARTAITGIAAIEDSKHGTGYSADPVMILQSLASPDASWAILDETKGGCRCSSGAGGVGRLHGGLHEFYAHVGLVSLLRWRPAWYPLQWSIRRNDMSRFAHCQRQAV